MRKKSMAVAVAIALTAGTVMPQITLADSFAQEEVQELEVQTDFSEGETADDSGFELEEADGDENTPDVEVDEETDSEEDSADLEEQQEDSQIFSSEEESSLNDGSLKPEDVFSDGGENEDELELGGEISGVAVGDGLYRENGESDNRNKQDYITYSEPMYSYLVAKDGGFYRVEYVDNKLLIEDYNADLTRISTKKLNPELSLFGGFYAGTNAFYVVWGQENQEESDAKEVMRLVKYDKNWNRVGATSLKGANTEIPFEGSGLRMTEYGNSLYIRTAHTMYMSSDGLNHQANLTWQVRTTDVKTIDVSYKYTGQEEGQAGHSFNQFILIDDHKNIVALDHGDASPRGVLLGIYEKIAAGESFKGKYFSDIVFNFKGEWGENYTGASIGGLEYSSSSYLTVGNSVVQDENWSDHEVRNIFVTSTSRSDCTKTPVKITNSDGSYSMSYPLTSNNNTSLKWITGYSESGDVSASTPQLVKLGSDSFLLLWAQTDGYGESNGKISYVFLNGTGDPASSVYTRNGYLSDCQPIVSGGKVIWYVTDGSKMTICSISADGSFYYEPETRFDSKEINCGLVEGTTWNPFSTNSDGKISYTSSDESVAKVDANGKVSLLSIGTCEITAHVAAGKKYAAKSTSYTLHVLNLKKQTIQGKNSINCSYGDIFNLGAMCEGNAELKYLSDDKRIASVSNTGQVTARGVGTTNLHVIAVATDIYARAVLDIKITVSKKNISKVNLIFTKIGDINSNEIDRNLAIINVNQILEEYEDYFVPVIDYKYSASGKLSSVIYTVSGRGNYTGTAKLEASPISKKSEIYSAKFTSTGNKISWKKETGAVGYYLYRKTSGDSEFKQIKKITNNNTTVWTDTKSSGVEGADVYSIRAYTRNGDKELLAETSNSIASGREVALKTAVSQKANSIKVTWEPLEGAASYIVYYKKGNSRWKEAARNVKKTEYTHSKLILGDQYTYTVKGVINGKETSYDRKGVSATVVPETVKLRKATSGGYNKVNISWNKAAGAAEYVIYIKKNGKWAKLATTKKTSYAHLNTKAFPVVTGKQYTYTVRAMGVNGKKAIYGSYSNTGITGRAMPARTAISSLNSSKNALTVSYKKVAGASGYQIAYSLYKDKGYRYVTVSGSRLSTTIRKLASKKNYFVKVRAYRTVNKKRCYGAYSPVKYKKTK